MLAVDDEVFAFWLTQMADGLTLARSLEAKGFIRKNQHRAGNHRLGDHGFIEVDDLLDLLPVQLTLKSLLTPFDTGDELCDVVVFGDLRLREFFAFKEIATRKPHFIEEIARIVGDEIKRAFLLTDPRR